MGLGISSEGVISGTPTTPGTFAFTIEVTDAALAIATASASINIAPRLAAALNGSGAIPMRQGAGGAEFGRMSGGIGPYTYQVSSGALPTGTALNGLSLSGSFTAAGAYSFAVTVTDGLGATATVKPTYYIWGPIAFAPLPGLQGLTADQRWHYSDALCYGSTISGCTAQFAYSGGTPGVKPIVSYTVVQGYGPWQPQGPLAGLSVSVSGGAVYVAVAANANPNAGGQWKVYVTLTDPQTHETTTRTAEFLVNFLYWAPAGP
jgi:hypothetical protein